MHFSHMLSQSATTENEPQYNFKETLKKNDTTCNKRFWLQFIVRYVQLSAVVCHFAVQERFLISQNLRLRDPLITVMVHFLKKVKCLLT